MENKNEKLGSVYLEVRGLDKERFKKLIKGMNIHPDYSSGLLNTGFLSIENWYNVYLGYTWCPTDATEPGSKLITLDELERLLTPEQEQQPIHFTISPDDYAEYQELKKLKETLKKILK